MNPSRRGLLVVLSGPSGVGKGTVVAAAIAARGEASARLRGSVSVTTRPRRPGEVQGAQQVRQHCPEAVLVYMLPPSREELRRRLAGRGSDDEETQRRRLEVAEREIALVRDYDYAIYNDDVAAAAHRFLAILEAEHWRTSRLDLKDLT